MSAIIPRVGCLIAVTALPRAILLATKMRPVMLALSQEIYR